MKVEIHICIFSPTARHVSPTQIGPRWKRDWEDSTITEKGGDKCCGKALKAAGGVEVVNVVRIRAPKKWVAGARIQAQSTGGRYMDRALIST